MQYANGILTKELIYQTARRLMYENGYKKTTYQMIAQKANVPVGLVNYHFKKQELLDKIYMDYLRRLLDLLPTIAVRIAGLSPAIIQKNQEKANRVFAGLDYSGILMLP